ncbi:MAG: hypothetical protein EZS28_037286, partial [Streblomastix strix]
MIEPLCSFANAFGSIPSQYAQNSLRQVPTNAYFTFSAVKDYDFFYESSSRTSQRAEWIEIQRAFKIGAEVHEKRF